MRRPPMWVHPFQAITDAVNNAHSLHYLRILIPRDFQHLHQAGIVTLAHVLQQHTVWQEFNGYDFCSAQETQQDTALDPVLRALSACPHLQQVAIMTECAGADALRNLIHSPTIAQFHLILTVYYIM
jgi:hypothetical protein